MAHSRDCLLAQRISIYLMCRLINCMILPTQLAATRNLPDAVHEKRGRLGGPLAREPQPPLPTLTRISNRRVHAA